MRIGMMFIVLTFTVICAVFSCSKESTEPTDSEAPTVAITYPANNSEFPEGTEITIIADATDNEEVKEVRFYIDGEFASLDETEPYEYIWDTGNTRDTDHTIYALAYDTSENNSISNTLFITLSPTEPVIDVDGNVYQTKLIGNQIWMTENLRVTHYRNGNEILYVTSNSEWNNTNSGAYCFYDNDSTNVDLYGILYNWCAIPMGVAPIGWHIPSDQEIMELEMYLGMGEDVIYNVGFRGTNEGSKLCGEAELWNNGELKNNPEFNSSGFDFIPGGQRSFYGDYLDLGFVGYFWSTTESSYDTKFFRRLKYNETAIYKDTTFMRLGFSIRCVKD